MPYEEPKPLRETLPKALTLLLAATTIIVCGTLLGFSFGAWLFY